MSMTKGCCKWVVTALALTVAGGVGAADIKQGEGGTAVQGAAGTQGSTDDNGLEHCAQPMAAMAVVEPQDHVSMALARYNLQSPTGIIRMMTERLWP